MFRRLLVPLDGSAMSEAAIPVAARFAARTGASLTLVHVIERNAPTAVHRERHLVTAEEAEAYLAEAVRLPALAGLTVATHVHTAEVSDVAASIYEHSAELAPDLVVMTTHGRGGARRLIFGAIAQQVIALGTTPVLLVRPSAAVAGPAGPAGPAGLRTILAPIDGDPDHEKSLPVAAELAAAFSCGLHLLMVVPGLRHLSGSDAAAGMLLPGATRLKLEMDTAGAEEYVQARARELAQSGVAATSEVFRGDPARAIVKSTRRLAGGLVVMGTHGRAGTDAFWAGSVAARVVARSRAPVLLVPLQGGKK
jgi:nucleotide-binding universal stress UspA family protein